MLDGQAPSRPRASQNNRPPRGPSRGGIGKRSAANLRTDKDGDLVMKASGSGRGTPQGGGRGGGTPASGPSRGGIRNKSSRPPINPAALQRAIAKGLNAGSAVLRNTDGAGGGKLEELAVGGWTESKAAKKSDGGRKQLIEFLERKATPPNATSGEKVRIRKSRVVGNTLVISVLPRDVASIMRLDSYNFVDVPISIKLNTETSAGAISTEANTLKEKLTSMLARRYNAATKLLDLSSLGTDPEFVDTEMFATKSTQSKFFPAIMKVCDDMFSNAAQKREAVASVTLANNNLPNTTTVTTLSITFPEIKNLDLSNNRFKDIGDLGAWKRRFKNLEHLVLTGNELPPEETYKEEILKSFPSLRVLNTTQVRTEEEVILAKQRNLGPPIQISNFRDEGQIGENFLKMFFPAWDTDRAALAATYYDVDSSFSLSINTSAPRSADAQNTHSPWEAYIKKSRNLTKITTLPARVSRLVKGAQNIGKTFGELPISQHPNLEAHTNKWCIECHSLPGLPDPTGQSSTGVGGLIIYTHGEFSEIDSSTGAVLALRSFDRTFVLGPGGGPGGVKVINDVFIVRAYGGFDAWTPTAELLSAVRSGELVLPEGAGVAVEGKSAEDLQREMVAIELCKATRMTWQYSLLCLEQTGWNLEAAGQAFEEVKASLPPDAWW